MSARKQDLSGQWDGHFTYPPGSRLPNTAFLANLQQSGSSLTGTIMEPDLYRRGSTVEAALSGVASGGSVDFTKTYCSGGRGYANPVDYVGQVLDDGARISGVWSLLDMNGKFEMVRTLSAENTAEMEEAEDLDA